MKDIITEYESISGQQVNFSKSEIVFSKKVNAGLRNDAFV